MQRGWVIRFGRLSRFRRLALPRSLLTACQRGGTLLYESDNRTLVGVVWRHPRDGDNGKGDFRS